MVCIYKYITHNDICYLSTYQKKMENWLSDWNNNTCNYWFISCLVYFTTIPNPRKYAKRYENRTEIQRILGVEIPKFKIVDSQLKHLSGFDFEIAVESTIEFKTLPDNKLFCLLDSICALPVPEEIDKNSCYFYYGLENTYSCWSKNGNKYFYVRFTDFGEKFLHSKDAYFNFEITKGSKTAEIEYGNY